MAENPNKISQIQVGDITYDICDATARQYIPQMTVYTSATTLNNNIISSDSTLPSPIVNFIRWNCFVYTYFKGFIKVSSKYTGSVGIIPRGYRPEESFDHHGICYHDDTTYNGYHEWSFYSGGGINFNSSITGEMIAPFNLTYYCIDELPSS